MKKLASYKITIHSQSWRQFYETNVGNEKNFNSSQDFVNGLLHFSFNFCYYQIANFKRRFGQLHHSDIKSQHEVLTFELTYLNELTDQRNPFQVQLNCQKICVEKLTNRESIYKCFVRYYLRLSIYSGFRCRRINIRPQSLWNLLFCYISCKNAICGSNRNLN